MVPGGGSTSIRKAWTVRKVAELLALRSAELISIAVREDVEHVILSKMEGNNSGEAKPRNKGQ